MGAIGLRANDDTKTRSVEIRIITGEQHARDWFQGRYRAFEAKHGRARNDLPTDRRMPAFDSHRPTQARRI
jgi:hypothetical protein